jgi:hypothetical protein
MKAIEFLKSEKGSVSVDWAVLSAVAAAMCLAAAGVLTAATNSFSQMSAAELAIQNNHGQNLFDTASYVPESDVLYDAYVAGLADLSADELGALGAFANRLHTVGYGETVNGTEPGACNAGNGNGYGHGYCKRFGGADEVANLNDFLMAVDNEFVTRGVGRPAHTHINDDLVGSAFNTMGMSQAEVRALLQG